VAKAFDAIGVEHQYSAALCCVDNSDARLTIDGECVLRQLAMIDGGFDGTKGHVQSVVPRLTERLVLSMSSALALLATFDVVGPVRAAQTRPIMLASSLVLFITFRITSIIVCIGHISLSTNGFKSSQRLQYIYIRCLFLYDKHTVCVL
jgi:hypothetical protein